MNTDAMMILRDSPGDSLRYLDSLNEWDAVSRILSGGKNDRCNRRGLIRQLDCLGSGQSSLGSSEVGGGEDFRGSISRIELGIREETTTLDFFVHSFGIVRDWLASKRAANSLGRNPPEVLIHSKPYSVVVNWICDPSRVEWHQFVKKLTLGEGGRMERRTERKKGRKTVRWREREETGIWWFGSRSTATHVSVDVECVPDPFE